MGDGPDFAYREILTGEALEKAALECSTFAYANLAGVDLAMLVPTPNGGADFAPLATGIERHAHSPEPDHSDRFTVRYRRAAATGEVFFSFTGEHLSTPKPAPEPSTLGLLAAGVLGLLTYGVAAARRRPT